MQKRFWIVGLTLFTGLGCGELRRSITDPSAVPESPAVLTDSAGVQYKAHEVIVRLSPGLSTNALNASLNKLGGSLVDTDTLLSNELGYVRLLLPPSVKADEAISELIESGVAEHAERNYVVHAIATPNDPSLDALWGMKKIDAISAWDIGVGNTSVVVAVSDTGIDRTHPALSGNLWTNENEIPGNGIDDDQNGFIDDIHGWDWANNDSDPMDDAGHGTHVAGTIGAVGNDGVGVVGVNWKARIMALKFLGANGSGSLYGGAQSILYAAANGAQVVNASWGCLGCYSSVIADAITVLGERGGLFVAAAGNDSNNNDVRPNYPSSHANENIIAVAASDSNDLKAGFSNWGVTSVDIAAPGVGILSTLPGNTYAAWSGTSMAAPHVAGAAALYIATFGALDPVVLKEKLLNSADPVGAFNGVVVSGARLNLFGLMGADDVPPQTPSNFSALSVARGSVRATWQNPSDPDFAMTVLRWGPDANFMPNTVNIEASLSSTTVDNLQDGIHYFQAYAVDNRDNQSLPTVPLKVEIFDNQAPPQVIDLQAETIAGTALNAWVQNSSGALSEFWKAAYAYDGLEDTGWMSPARAVPQEEFLEVRLEVATSIDQLDLSPNPAYLDTFPVDFDIDVSSDGTQWKLVRQVRNATPPKDQTVVTLGFEPIMAEFVRLRILRSRLQQSGLYYAGIAEMRVRKRSVAAQTLKLSFTAPGDDPGLGTTRAYDIRRSTSLITTDNFLAATPVPWSTPKSSGVLESAPVSGLTPETTYYFALRAQDDAGNYSILSNIASATTAILPPNTIVDIRANAHPTDPSTAILTWTAPGGNGFTGKASTYDMRMARFPIDDSNFASATPVPDLNAPLSAGSAESFLVTGLSVRTLYYFALKAADQTGALGNTSNLAAIWLADDSSRPIAWIENFAAHARPSAFPIQMNVINTTLPVSAYWSAQNLADGDPTSNWQVAVTDRFTPVDVTFDLESIKSVAQFRVFPASIGFPEDFLPESFEFALSADGINFEEVATARGMTAVDRMFFVFDIVPTPARYLRLRINTHGPGLRGAPPASPWYTALSELEVFAQDENFSAELTWSSPGVNGAALLSEKVAICHIPKGDTSKAHTIYVSKHALPKHLEHGDSVGRCEEKTPAPPSDPDTPPPTPEPLIKLCHVEQDNKTNTQTILVEESKVATHLDHGDTKGACANETQYLCSSYDIRRSQVPMSENNFDDALPLPIALPATPGSLEFLRVPALELETTYYFAMACLDDTGARGSIAYALEIRAPDIKPAPVTDLNIVTTKVTGNVVALEFMSTGDNAFSLQATAYDLRYSQNFITPDTWANATRVSTGTPSFPGLREEFAISELVHTSKYYFAVRVVDALQQQSLLSNIALALTDDLTPPSLTSDLVASPPPFPGTELNATAESSASYSQYTMEENLSDHNPATSWLSPASDADTPQSIVFTLDQPTSLGRMRLLPTPGIASIMPQAMRIEVRPNTSASTPWTTVLSDERVAMDESDDSWREWVLGAAPAQEIRLTFTTTRYFSGAYFVGFSEAEFYSDGSNAIALDLRWTAPADITHDSASVQVKSYDMRYDFNSIDAESYLSAAQLEGEPDPVAQGQLQFMNATNLLPQTAYCFALKARANDALGNVSAVSNSACATTRGLPPSTITDLSPSDVRSSRVTLTWTAPVPATNAMGAFYDMRFSIDRLNTENWEAATTVGNLPTPAPQGSIESILVEGLTPLSLYHFGVRTIDAEGNISAISNIAIVTTLDGIPPGTITDLTAQTDPFADRSIILRWTAVGSDGPLGQASSYDLRYALTPITPNNFDNAESFLTNTPQLSGSTEILNLIGLLPEAHYYFAIKALDQDLNRSDMSDMADAWTRTEPPSKIDDLRISGGHGGEIGTAGLQLSWTAPGGNGTEGTAMTYDLRYSLSFITSANFGSATPAAGIIAPQPGGSTQSFMIEGLDPATTYYVGIRAADDKANIGLLSNIAIGKPPDTSGPDQVLDLAAATGTLPSTVQLSWTAPSDNGLSAPIGGYDLRYSLSPITSGNFYSAQKVPGIVAPQPAGSAHIFTAKTMPDETLVYFALKAFDDTGNTSLLSNVVSARTLDVPPSAINALRTLENAATTLSVEWGAVGDDGMVGIAANYELRYSGVPLSASNFSGGILVPTPVPLTPSTLQSALISGLSSNTTYYVAIIAIDERGNKGNISNVLTADTADTIAPGQIADLQGTMAADNGAVTLNWTAVGDDAYVGTATTYEVRYAKTPVTEASWSSASIAQGTPAPRIATTPETFTVTGLQGEDYYYFAIRAVDEVGNKGALSSSAGAPTQPVPPAKVSDLKAIPGPGFVTLNWTAPGDNGQDGTASVYDIRLSKNLITESNFPSQTAVENIPQPLVAGTTQSIQTQALPESTTYCFALRAIDDVGGTSALSNVACVETMDQTGPSKPLSFAVSTTTPTRQELSIINAQVSSELGDSWRAAALIDGVLTSAWSSTGSILPQTHTIVASLSGPAFADRIELRADNIYNDLFPREFLIEVSGDGTNWTVVAFEQDYQTTGASWLSFGFLPQNVSTVRITISNTARSFGLHYAIIAEMRIFRAPAQTGEARLTWTAPGDDASTGVSDHYEIYRAQMAFGLASLGSATLVTDPMPPTPFPAGLLQAINYTGLSGEAPYYWAVRAIDEAGNTGTLSTVVLATTNIVPPSPITDMSGTTLSTTSIQLSWTAVGDDGVLGQASAYELRYAPWSLGEHNLNLATLVSGLPVPAAPGDTEIFQVDGLDAGVLYRCALVAIDEAGNRSMVSNIAYALTTPLPDIIVPGNITDLLARQPSGGGVITQSSSAAWSSEQPGFEAQNLTDAQLSTPWVSAATDTPTAEVVRLELVDLEEIDSINVWPAQGLADLFPPSFDVRISADGLQWTTVATENAYMATDGVPYTLTFVPAEIRYVEFEATTLVQQSNGLWYVGLAEIDIISAQPPVGSILLDWTAPGDDGYIGTATNYTIMYSSCPYDPLSAISVPAPLPAPALSPERMRLEGLVAGTYCIAVQAIDEAGNTGGVSNIEQINVP